MQLTIAEGGCLCGSIRYRINGAPRVASTCFCRSCRLASGASSVAWCSVDVDQFALVTGKLAVFSSSPPVTRSFCGACGTPIAYQHSDDRNVIELTIATLDEPQRVPPTREIWHSQRIGWAASDASLPHFAGDSDSELVKST